MLLATSVVIGADARSISVTVIGAIEAGATEIGPVDVCAIGTAAALCLMLGVEPQLVVPNGEIDGAAAGAETAARGALVTGLEAVRGAL